MQVWSVVHIVNLIAMDGLNLLGKHIVHIQNAMRYVKMSSARLQNSNNISKKRKFSKQKKTQR